MEIPAAGFAETELGTVQTEFATDGHPAFQFHATYVCPAEFTAESVQALKPSELKDFMMELQSVSPCAVFEYIPFPAQRIESKSAG